MNRRNFLKSLSQLSAFMYLRNGFAKADSDADYDGPIFVSYHCRGGIDQSSWVDPRADEDVNLWAKDSSYLTAGNIRYAPMVNNQTFFEKYANMSLVINGISLETNSHGIAEVYRPTAQQGKGYPQINELFAAINGTSMPMAYVGSGYKAKINLIPKSNIPSISLLNKVSIPTSESNGTPKVHPEIQNILNQSKKDRFSYLKNQVDLDSQYLQRVKELEQSFNNSGSLARIADVLPEKLDGDSRLENSMHAFLIAASAGLSCSAIFGHGGFDTHVNHDERMTNDASPLTALNNRVDFLWEKAKELGLDDRLVVYITSDVGRRPFYNNNGGKDHWHVSSDIIMKKNVLWTNKVVGASGAKHELLTMNKDLTLNENSDLLIRPGHVHLTLRNILGIDSHKHSKTYDIKNDEEFPLLHEAEHTDYL